ncbi:RagB/SusD family nutrient uptake outer membrane protein [bacterium]|nr:MAG: RagB/SusD family nutrient uptake outer membrane protein [bacterium]
MKKLSLSLVALVFIAFACKELKVVNPNEPTPDVLNNEEGLQRASTGVYEAMGQGWFEWISWFAHETMGDAFVVPYGNYNWRSISTPNFITFSDGETRRPIDNDRGVPQPDVLQQIDDRTESQPVLLYEWRQMYRINNEANLILQTLNAGTVSFSGNANEKEKGYRAWAYFWKAFAYSRVVSTYEKSLIIDTYGQTNDNYLEKDVMIAEINRLADSVIANASGFDQIASAVVPAQFAPIPTSASLAQLANTLKARTLLVNKYRSDMTAADWQQIETWTAAGVQTTTGSFRLRADNATYLGSTSPIYRYWLGWGFVSQRLIQDFYPGDNRLAAFSVDASAGNSGAISDTVFQYTGARGDNFISPFFIDPPYAEANVGDLDFFLISAEENLLMAAEAKLALNKPGEAATLINTVRTIQNAGLAAEDANSISWEIIRRERRVALAGRHGALSFYDARRYKWILPAADGGGRSGVWVFKRTNGVVEKLDKNATIIFNYAPYWPVPVHEITFNPIDDGQAPS